MDEEDDELSSSAFKSLGGDKLIEFDEVPTDESPTAFGEFVLVWPGNEADEPPATELGAR